MKSQEGARLVVTVRYLGVVAEARFPPVRSLGPRASK